MAFLVATTSLPAVYRQNGYARTTTAGTPHARANIFARKNCLIVVITRHQNYQAVCPGKNISRNKGSLKKEKKQGELVFKMERSVK